MTTLATVDRNIPILVVDDYPSMRRIVKNCLRQLGFENVQEAENGPSALELLKTNEFKFVISDWSLPEMSAEELLQSLRANKKHSTVPVLVVAAEQEKEKVTKASAVIVKPFTTSILEKKMEEALS